MNFYEIDTLINLSVAFNSVSGDPIDPTDVTLLVQSPPDPADPGTLPPKDTYTLAAGQVVRDGVGLYHYGLTPNQVGTWTYKWLGAGNIEVTTPDTQFGINQTVFFESSATIFADQFVSDYPEFANTTAYPPSAIAYWLNVANLSLDPKRWSTAPPPSGSGPSMMDLGTALFIAHNLVLERQAALDAQLPAQDGQPGPPGVSTGAVASVTGTPVSVSYNAAMLDAAAGHWALTTYGQRFARLAKYAGMGGLQVGHGWGRAGSLGWGW